MDNPALGQRIRQLRQDQGLTQAALGGTELSESYISLIEAGRRVPSAEALSYLADRLGCPADLLRSAVQPNDAAQAELLIRRGEWETTSGQAQHAIGHLEEGLDLAQQLGLHALASRGRAGLAKALEADGRLKDAIDQWEKLLEDSRHDRRNTSMATAAVGLSRCYREAGDLERAARVADAFWREGSSAAGPDDRVVVGATLLAAYIELGDIVRSGAIADELVALAEDIDTPMSTAAAYWNAAVVAENEGRVADALLLAERAQARLAHTEDVRNRARLQVTRAGLLLRKQPPDTELALELLRDAQPVIEQFASKVDSCYCQTELARAYLLLEEYEHAAAIATETIATLSQSDARVEKARALMVRATANAGLERRTEAIADATEAADLLHALGASRHAASVWSELAELYLGLGDTAGAIEAFRRSTELFGARPTAVRADRSGVARSSRSARAS